MPHFPLNHPLARLYRLIAAGTALLMLGWSVAAVVVGDEGAVLGLGSDTALGYVIGGLAVVVLLGLFLPRRQQHFVNEIVGATLIVLGLLGLAVLHNPANYLDLSVAHCVALFLTGTALVTAGMYTKPGTPEQARAEEIYRHSSLGRVAEPAKELSDHGGDQRVPGNRPG